MTKHRGVGSSLRPAREAARAQARAAGVGLPRPSAGVPDTPAAGLVVGDWQLEQDPTSGALIARHQPTSTVRELLACPAEPPSTSEEGESDF